MPKRGTIKTSPCYLLLRAACRQRQRILLQLRHLALHAVQLLHVAKEVGDLSVREGGAREEGKWKGGWAVGLRKRT